MYDLKNKIDNSVFPGHQGGPHDHVIAGLAVALHLAKQPAFKEYQAKVLSNCQAMVKALLKKNYQLVSGGSDNHLCLVDLGNKQLDGARVEAVLEQVNIIINKNTVPTDKSAIVPRGLRLGTPAMTSRGLVESDFEQVVEFIDRGVKLTASIKEKSGPKLADFKQYVNQNAGNIPEFSQLRGEVLQFCSKFDVPQ